MMLLYYPQILQRLLIGYKENSSGMEANAFSEKMEADRISSVLN